MGKTATKSPSSTLQARILALRLVLAETIHAYLHETLDTPQRQHLGPILHSITGLFVQAMIPVLDDPLARDRAELKQRMLASQQFVNRMLAGNGLADAQVLVFINHAYRLITLRVAHDLGVDDWPEH